jgi:hypothetical protein
MSENYFLHTYTPSCPGALPQEQFYFDILILHFTIETGNPPLLACSLQPLLRVSHEDSPERTEIIKNTGEFQPFFKNWNVNGLDANHGSFIYSASEGMCFA